MMRAQSADVCMACMHPSCLTRERDIIQEEVMGHIQGFYHRLVVINVILSDKYCKKQFNQLCESSIIKIYSFA